MVRRRRIVGAARRARRVLLLAGGLARHWPDMAPHARTHLDALTRELEWQRLHDRGVMRAGELMERSNNLCLELGSGSVIRAGWIGVDVTEDADLQLDLRRPLPFPEGSVAEIHSEHFFEHLSYPDELVPLLAECRRVLVRGGLISFSVPGLRRYLELYCAGDTSELRRLVSDAPAGLFDRSALDLVSWLALRAGEHRTLFDEENAALRLQEVGFDDVRVRPFDPARDYSFRESSIYIEARRP